MNKGDEALDIEDCLDFDPVALSEACKEAAREAYRQPLPPGFTMAEYERWRA